MMCFSKLAMKPCLENLVPYLDPILQVFILNELSEEKLFRDSFIFKESIISKISSTLGINGVSKLKMEDYSPFLKKEICMKIFEFFKDNWTIMKNAKLRTTESIAFLKSLILETNSVLNESVSETKSKTKEHILIYNEMKLLKKKLKIMNYPDTVYDFKIKKDQISSLSKSIQEMSGYRKRAKSNADDVVLKQNLVEKMQLDVTRCQRRRDQHYYPDVVKRQENNFGLNEGDCENLSCIQNDKMRFTESINSNKDQSFIQYYISMKSEDNYKIEDGIWEPKGNLVCTLYDESSTFSRIKDLDVSQNSKYFVSISPNNIKMWNCENILEVNEIFNIYSVQNLTCCSMLDCSYSFVTGSEKGTLDLYSPFEFEDKASSAIYKDSFLKSCYLMNRITHSGEGAIINCRSKILEAEREHCVIYSTQRGFIHIYDLRSRNPVFDFNVGLKYGLLSCMNFATKNKDEMLIGTMDGNLLTYDFRYNVINDIRIDYKDINNVNISNCKYSYDASITNIQPFYPYRHRRYKLNDANYLSPLAFISTSDCQVSLIDLTDKEDGVKGNQTILLSRQHTGKGDKVGKFVEKSDVWINDYPSISHKLSVYNSIFGSNLKSDYKNSICTEFKSSEFSSSILSSMHGSDIRSPHPCSMKSLLCPKNAKLNYSASFLVGGDNTGKIRYWNIEKDVNRRRQANENSNENAYIIKDVTTIEEEKDDDQSQTLDNANTNSYSVYEGHTGSVNALGMIYQYNNQKITSSYLISCSSDSTIKIWN